MTGHRERGSGTVLVLGLCGVAVVLLTVTVLLGGAVQARHRAAAAADLAALAAADVLLGRAAGQPCAAAGRVAAAQGGVLVRCDVAVDASVTVRVDVVPAGAAAVLGTATTTARAGPAP